MPDCVCLFGEIGGRRVLISGDTAIGDQGENLGVVGWLDMHWGSAPKRYVASLEKLAALGADLMLPGHGRAIDGKRAVADSLDHGIARLRQLLAVPHLHTMMGLDMSE
jgi:glyoxylase-like metal-dependent hydrolase (beta-lactamase superfamily II)